MLRQLRLLRKNRNMENTIKYISQSKTQLAKRYNVSLPTFNNWLKDIEGLKLRPNQRVFTPRQIEYIFKDVGEPPN
jgi:transposase